ncbi:MAG: hypothetical protein R3F39_00895 [Myxococcota bacterium]
MRMTRLERRWLLRIFAAMVPGPASGGFAVAGDDVGVARFLDDLEARSPLEPLLGLRIAVWMVTLGPLVWRLKLRTFGRLAPDDQVAFLDALSASRVYVLRELPVLLKTFLCMGLFALPAAQRAIGLPVSDEAMPRWARPS